MENLGQAQMKQRVALFISCRKLVNLDALSKSDPQAEVYIKDRTTNNWSLVGKTEIIQNNLNPDFSTFIQCDYFFEREQQVKVMLYDIDDNKGNKDYIGKCETTLGKIIGSTRQTFVTDLIHEKKSGSRGKIVIRVDNMNVSNDEIRMKLSADLVPISSLCCTGINNPYYLISKVRDASESGREFVRVYQSPNLINTAKPIWNPTKIKLGIICNGDKNVPLKFEVYSYDEAGTHQLYGEFQTTVNEILALEQKQCQLNKKGNKGGYLTFDSFSVIEMPNFMEYLRSGWAINLALAIDFTASNGELSDVRSLHKQDPTGQQLNQYEQALLQVGKVVEPYAMNGQFACFGFGGIPRFLGSNAISHCFNLNGQSVPFVNGMNNVFNSYKNAIVNTGLAGPTYFSHVLKGLLQYVLSCMNLQMYHVMLIITDGEIHDMKETTDMIVELSKYPVSIIIVGVGDEDFEKMKYLDSDEKILRNSKGEPAQRDIVQFVRYQDYSHSDISILAEEVLKEMPDQIVGYMLQRGIKPLKQEWIDVNQAAETHLDQ